MAKLVEATSGNAAMRLCGYVATRLWGGYVATLRLWGGYAATVRLWVASCERGHVQLIVVCHCRLLTGP